MAYSKTLVSTADSPPGTNSIMDLEKVQIQKKAALCLGLFILQLKSVLSMGIPGISKGKRVKLALTELQKMRLPEGLWNGKGLQKHRKMTGSFSPLLGIRTLRISNKGRLLVSNVLFALFFVGPMTTVVFQQNYGCTVCYMESDGDLSLCLLPSSLLRLRANQKDFRCFRFSFLKLYWIE